MTATASVLRALHRIHQQLSDLRDRKDRGPKQIQAREHNLANQQDTLHEVQEKLLQTRIAADQKQLDLKSKENKILDWKFKLNSCASNKEYQALLEQIAAAEAAGSVLSDEILELFERIDELEGEVQEAKSRLDRTAQDLEQARDHVARDSKGISIDTMRLERELAEAEAALPEDFQADYHRVVRARGTDGLAAVDETCCGGCHQQITPNQQNCLALGQSIICTACGRLLYQTDEAGG